MKKLLALIVFVLLLCQVSSYAENTVTAFPEKNHISSLLGKMIDEEEVACPKTLECNLKMLHFEATEAYLERNHPGAGPLLYIVFQVYSKDPNCLPVYPENEHEDQIEFNGKIISLDQFRGHKNLISFELMAGNNSSSWYEYTNEGLFVCVCIMNPDMNELEKASIKSFRCWCENLQTGRTESGTIEVEIPAMILSPNN